MEFFGGQQLPLAVTFSVMVGVAFVALVCDFLKGYNEQLRELVLEMHMREQRTLRGLHPLAANHATGLADTSAVGRLAIRLKDRLAIKNAVERVSKRFVASPLLDETTPTNERSDQRAPHEGELARAAELAMSRENGILRPRKTTIEGPAAIGHPAPALTDIRIRRKAAMLARLGEVRLTTPEEPNATALTEELCSIPAGRNLDQKNLLDRILAATVAETPLHRERGRARSAVRDDLYSNIESRVNSIESTGGLPAEPAEIETTIDAKKNKLPPHRRHVKLPAGFQDGFVLSKLTKARRAVSGLVVSVGVGNPEQTAGPIPEEVNVLMQQFLGPQDFGCQSAEDEFLLIFPNDHGADAQRKLAEISERLWDFQLCSMGSLSILFSWGGVEVTGESISDAIHSASERMHATRRGREGAPGPRMQAFDEPAHSVAV